MGDQAEQLRAEALEKAFHNQTPIPRSLSGQCRVLTITSGKGGVGKTSLVLNLGLALIRFGYKVVIIDADLGLANIDVMINAIPRYNLIDVINGEKQIKDIMVSGPLDLKIIPGGSGLFDLANIDQAKRAVLLNQMGDLENEGDFILIDTAAGLSRNVISFVDAADDFILVTTPEPTALTDAYGMLKVVAEKGLQSRSEVIVNITRSMQQGQKTFNGLNRVVQQYLPSMKLNYLGDVRYDSAVSNAVHNYVPFVISRPKSNASAAINRIAWRIAANGEAGMSGRTGMIGFIDRLKELTC